MDNTNGTEAAKDKRNAYARMYYKKWREKNREKKSEYNARYWFKKTQSQAE